MEINAQKEGEPESEEMKVDVEIALRRRRRVLRAHTYASRVSAPIQGFHARTYWGRRKNALRGKTTGREREYPHCSSRAGRKGGNEMRRSEVCETVIRKCGERGQSQRRKEDERRAVPRRVQAFGEHEKAIPPAPCTLREEVRPLTVGPVG